MRRLAVEAGFVLRFVDGLPPINRPSPCSSVAVYC